MSLPGYPGGPGFRGIDSVKTPGLQNPHIGGRPNPVKIVPQFPPEDHGFAPQQRVNSQPCAPPGPSTSDENEGKWRNAVLSVVPCLNAEGVTRALKILDLASTNAHQAKNLEKALFKSTVDECSLMIGKALLSVRILQDELLQELIKIKTLYPKLPNASTSPESYAGNAFQLPNAGQSLAQAIHSVIDTDAAPQSTPWWTGQMQAGLGGQLPHTFGEAPGSMVDSMPLGAEAAGLTDWQNSPAAHMAQFPGPVHQNAHAGGQQKQQKVAAAQDPRRNVKKNPSAQYGSNMPTDLPPADGKFKEGQQKTVAEILGELSKLDSDTIFIVRRINKLGFKAARILRKHFSQYGKLIQVQRTQSTMKHRFGHDCTPYRRPSSLGFIQMANKNDVKTILEKGEEQVIEGFEHCPIIVQKFVIPTKNPKQDGQLEMPGLLEEENEEDDDGDQDNEAEDDPGDYLEPQPQVSGGSGSSDRSDSRAGQDKESLQLQSTDIGSGRSASMARTVSHDDSEAGEDS